MEAVKPESTFSDLYDYLSGREEYAGLFKGSYLSNYSWGETTLGGTYGRIVIKIIQKIFVKMLAM